MDNALNELLRQPGIWRAGERQHEPTSAHITTGYAGLDAGLPGGGWPRGALTEILHDHSGIGELRLVLPALARLSHEGRWLAFIAPPHIPYAPALAAAGIDLSRVLLVHPRGDHNDTLWAMEQALRAGTCGAVLAWPRRVNGTGLRRLQLAAETGDTPGWLFRRETLRRTASPAALRMQLSREDAHLRVDLIKARGGGRRQTLLLDLSAAGTKATPSTSPVTPVSQRQAPTTETPRPEPLRQRPCHPLPRAHGRSRVAQMDLPLTGPSHT
ncbi:translesion DNA synthesis-associated protein ImuA [Arhodomonas sp. AD133]|uniref:translesion DNA synthesis-associated protein ImuA n=1 Tax=Arhodomonas sp. AD133 TaxID=3415009 RepID=UPI003EC04327